MHDWSAIFFFFFPLSIFTFTVYPIHSENKRQQKKKKKLSILLSIVYCIHNDTYANNCNHRFEFQIRESEATDENCILIEIPHFIDHFNQNDKMVQHPRIGCKCLSVCVTTHLYWFICSVLTVYLGRMPCDKWKSTKLNWKQKNKRRLANVCTLRIDKL